MAGHNNPIQNNLLNIPKSQLLDDGETVLPYVTVRDDAFPLKENLMKPYPFQALSYEKRAFNYRLSRARRLEQNVFGILTNHFQVFLLPIQLEPIKLLLQAVLHKLSTRENNVAIFTTWNF